MLGEDGTHVLVFNGEIYNFRELREELIRCGHCFKSRSDSEVIVHGYEQWGENVVDRLCGMFAFTIWNSRSSTLFLARDPMGIKPLYYWWSPAGAFYFASEIKAFLALSDFRPTANYQSLRQYLEFNFIWDPDQTSLLGIQKVPAGHFLVVRRTDLDSERRPTPRRYYIPPETDAVQDTCTQVDRHSDVLFETLRKVVREHLVADVPVALLLSGGIDSSVIAALAAREGRLRTLSMGFAKSTIDERPHARRVSEYIGSQHREIIIEPDQVVSDLEKSVWFVDDLFGDWGVITTMMLYRKCREAGVKVVLVGEGADELFGGYPNFVSAGGVDSDRLDIFRRTLRLYRWYSGRRWGKVLWDFTHTVSSLHREAGEDSFSTVRLFETRYQLPNCYNMKVDKASMAASVEARVPYLDTRIANLGFRTPRSLLQRQGTNKYLLRHMANRHQLLPSPITEREKFGASVAATWLEQVPSFRQFARETILDTGGWAKPLGLHRAMARYFDSGSKGYGFPHPLSIFSILAWRILLLNLWSRLYLTREPIPPASFAVDPRTLAASSLISQTRVVS
jgi:asparagine synthase (glutamine-hydrolysing)